MMKKLRPFLPLLALGLLPLVGCQDGDLTSDLTDVDLQELALEDQLTLELLADPASMETALDLAGIQNSAAQRHGWGHGANNGYRALAELCFRNALGALAQGDQVRAMEQARQGRQLVAQSIEMAGGTNAIVGMVERLEALGLSVTADPDAFVNSGKLGLQLGQLAVMARNAFQKGERTRAGALGVLAEQAFRHNHRHQNQNQNQVGAVGAEVAVALGAEAVDLATGLLEKQDGGATPEQEELLATATEFRLQAETALAATEEQRAAHLAHLAQWWALKAVVLPGGITDEDARVVQALATDLLAEAEAVLALGEPTELQTTLLAKAARMRARGSENLGNGVCRGVGSLWQSAVISSYLIG